MMKWTALALLGVNLILALTLALSDGPEPPQVAFPTSDAPPIVLLSEVEPPPAPPSPEHAAEPTLATADTHPAPAAAAEDPHAPTPGDEAHGSAPTQSEAGSSSHPTASSEEKTAPQTHSESETPHQNPQAPHPKEAATLATAEPEIPEPPPEPAPPQPQLHDYCYRLGPIASKKDLDTLRARLQRTLGVRGRAETQKVPIRTGYWVFIPPQPIPQAEATVRQLRRKGIRDLYLLREGDNRGAISLGLYKQRSFALRRQKQLAAKGIDSEIQPRYKPGRRYWLVVHYRGEHAPGERTWKRIEKDIHGLRRRRQDCA